MSCVICFMNNTPLSKKKVGTLENSEIHKKVTREHWMAAHRSQRSILILKFHTSLHYLDSSKIKILLSSQWKLYLAKAPTWMKSVPSGKMDLLGEKRCKVKMSPVMYALVPVKGLLETSETHAGNNMAYIYLTIKYKEAYLWKSLKAISHDYI